MSEASSTSSAGWHPDPSGRHELRYWDGNGWTDSVSDQGAQATDPVGAPPAPMPATMPAAMPPTAYPTATPYQPMGYSTNPPKQKVAAALLAFFLGIFGAHRFYLGYKGLGLTMLLLTVLSLFILSPFVGIWAFVEFIMILTGNLKDSEGRDLV